MAYWDWGAIAGWHLGIARFVGEFDPREEFNVFFEADDRHKQIMKRHGSGHFSPQMALWWACLNRHFNAVAKKNREKQL
jgi:hypothetical protein